MPSSSLRARVGAGIVVLGLAGGASVTTAVAAHAGDRTPLTRVVAPAGADGHPAVAKVVDQAPKVHTGKHRTRQQEIRQARREARKVLRIVKRLRGRPYVWGAAGPHAFDCSGLVQFVFRRALDRHLPRSTWAQWKAIKHIHRSQAKPGDLVYAHNLSHVGIYAGEGYWWEAPHTGSHVRKVRIWAWHPRFARVIPRP